jgi:hypothetical protein
MEEIDLRLMVILIKLPKRRKRKKSRAKLIDFNKFKKLCY